MWTPKLSPPIGHFELAKAIEKAIQTKELKIGDRLPAQRILAYQLNINPTTVARAYKLVTEKGLIGGQIGRGTYVLKQIQSTLFNIALQSKEDDFIDMSINRLHSDSKITEINYQIRDEYSKKLYTLDSANYSNVDNQKLFQYINQALIERFNNAISNYLKQSRNTYFSANQIIGIPSCQYGIHYVLSKFCQKGDVVLVDEYTAPAIISAANSLSLRMHSVKNDEHGILPESLDSVIKQTKAKVVIMIPSHQSPMATTQSKLRRQLIAKVINKHEIILIEDDIYGSYKTPDPLSKYVDKNAFLISGFSKCLTGAHRVAFIASQSNLFNTLKKDIHETYWLLSQDALFHIITAIEKNYIYQSIDYINKLTNEKNILLNNTLNQSLKLNAPHQWLEIEADIIHRLEKNHIAFAHHRYFKTSPPKRNSNIQHNNFVRLSVIGISYQQLLDFTQVYNSVK